MATAVLENVNKFDYLGLRRRPTYDEIIGLIKENETLTGKLPNRDATFFKASNEGSFFDGLDHLEILKEQQHRILQRQMQDLLLRQNVRANGGTFHLERHLQTLPSDTPAPAEVEPDRNTLSVGLQSDLQRREQQLRDRQQQTGEAHRSLLSRATMPIIEGLLSMGGQSSRVFNRTGADTPASVFDSPAASVRPTGADTPVVSEGETDATTEELIVNSLRFRHPNATTGEINRVARTLVKYSNLKPEQIATSFSNFYMLNDMYDVLYRNGFISDEVMEDYQTLTNEISQEGGGRKRASLLRRLANHYRDHIYNNYISHISNRPVPA